MLRPNELSHAGNSTEDTPVAGGQEDSTQIRTSVRPPLSPRAKRNRNPHRGVGMAGAGILAIVAGGVAVANIERGPQAPSDGIRLTDETLKKTYMCLREQFHSRSEQDLGNSDSWLDESCRNSSDPQTRYFMQLVDESDTPLKEAARLRDAVLAQAGITNPDSDGITPGLVSWTSTPRNTRDGSPVTVMEIADKEAAQKAADEGLIVLTYGDEN